ncbi:hypothetical protein F2Q68_00019599 [Brassica cretica]|uniref:Prokaryotic-type class I peptide chain release factors domain-containing protein n=1 Tax=Brassica cretica TaxID=69181 RepID=A0A8S9FYU9_BRACR|nr:hypothetical protein F2Q68_00019599 [Brassica cretica]
MIKLLTIERNRSKHPRGYDKACVCNKGYSELEKNRINRDGELVISSTKTRTQKGNIDDALAKLQAIIDAASYVPPPPSEEQKKKIVKMAAKADEKRLKSKKVLSDKKAARRDRSSWD